MTVNNGIRRRISIRNHSNNGKAESRARKNDEGSHMNTKIWTDIDKSYALEV